jgi:transposase
MWTDAARAECGAFRGTYPSSMSGSEWVLIAPRLPSPEPPRRSAFGMMIGTDMSWPMRLIVDGIFYVLRNGVTWRALPSDFPPWKTVYGWFTRFARINVILVAIDRERAGREAQPSAAIVDSQSAKAT